MVETKFYFEQYLHLREKAGKSRVDSKNQLNLSEATAQTLELGFQCYSKGISLEKVIDFIQKIYVIDLTKKKETGVFNPDEIN
ncbi:hypothetical protein [Sporolactobacillus sp. KGMB 08714]|uniref:hypothetical protein n=1 Tax=Sporolactobacillus sp. KGMB 08714 TaxID=3064704 RepID=UPI002FBEEF34